MGSAVFIKSASGPKGFPADSGAEVAVVGRSNSGKSSAINKITGVHKLARTSKTPGRTQLINFFDLGANRRIVDLPGYGFARVAPAVRAEWQGLLEAYFNRRKSLAGIVITMDIRRGVTVLDATMLDWAEALGFPVLLLLTKADKLSRNAVAKQCRAVAAATRSDVHQVAFSSLSGLGVDGATRKLDEWLGVGTNA